MKTAYDSDKSTIEYPNNFHKHHKSDCFTIYYKRHSILFNLVNQVVGSETRGDDIPHSYISRNKQADKLKHKKLELIIPSLVKEGLGFSLTA